MAVSSLTPDTGLISLAKSSVADFIAAASVPAASGFGRHQTLGCQSRYGWFHSRPPAVQSFETVLVSRVTAPLSAIARPQTIEADVSKVIL